MTSKINVLHELERLSYDYVFTSDEEIKVLCPFHNDKSPSCNINIEKTVFKCHTAGCGASGDFITFLARVLKSTRRIIFEDLSRRYDFDTSKVIDSSTIERYHNDIWSALPFLKQLHIRGVDDTLIRKYRIGFNNGRITIPIMNKNGLFVNIRQYLPGAPGSKKMRNMKGYGQIRLFPIEQLKYGAIVICGGELKAIVTADLLNAHGIGAISTTAGEDNWHKEFTEEIRDKEIHVCLDIDKPGREAAQTLCAQISAHVKTLKNLSLPLDEDTYPSGDVNDWIGQEKATASNFLDLIVGTEEWKPHEISFIDKSEPENLELIEAVSADKVNKRIRLKCVIAAIDTSPYVIPKKLSITCTRDQDFCTICPVLRLTEDEDGKASMIIQPESSAILSMVATHKSLQREAIIEALEMPQCKVVEFQPTEFYSVEDTRISPRLEITNTAQERVMQPALCIGENLELNECFELTGKLFPHPKTQQSTFLISKIKPTLDALSTFKLENDLSVFEPDEWTDESLDKKLNEIYNDFEANVTRIFKRKDLHFMVDLAYHSVLFMRFDSKIIKGWAEVLIIGDSSQGKSETTLQLMKHYQLGEKVECKNATVAGLLGGLQQMGKRWFVSWGIIPTHDKRLVILEELKGTSYEVISKLTDMRSSGIAEIPKIEKRRTRARTRLIALSNPRSDRSVSSYNFGIEAIKELIGGLEDIRRFDACLLISANEIQASELNKLQRARPNVKHKFTSDKCRDLILWGWTRNPEQVVIEDEKLILDEATKLCGEFVEVIPIVDRGSMRYKIARLSIALAVRVYSHEKDSVIVRSCHIKYVCDFLRRIYSSNVFGYLDFSNAILASENLISEKELKGHILQAPWPKDFAEQLLHTDKVESRDICDWCGWDQVEGLKMISYFVRKHALKRDGRMYRKTAPFIIFLKELLHSEELEQTTRPDFIKEEF